MNAELYKSKIKKKGSKWILDVLQYLPNIKNIVYCLLGGTLFSLSRLKL